MTPACLVPFSRNAVDAVVFTVKMSPPWSWMVKESVPTEATVPITWVRTTRTLAAVMVAACASVPAIGVTVTCSPTVTPVGAVTAPVSA